MKKGVLIFIAGITLLSFVLVGFIGSIPTGIVPVVYISSVTILDFNGNAPTINPATSVKAITIEYYDRDKYAPFQYQGSEYIAYFFQTSVQPANATNRTFQYRVGENPYVIIDPDNDQASYKGLFFIKTLELASIDAGITKFKTHIYCNAKDGGNAPEDDILLTVKYVK
jgi:hypothetical protein